LPYESYENQPIRTDFFNTHGRVHSQDRILFETGSRVLELLHALDRGEMFEHTTSLTGGLVAKILLPAYLEDADDDTPIFRSSLLLGGD